ncbi:MAG: restriction endonuclease subunit S [Pseudomonadota bacterium]
MSVDTRNLSELAKLGSGGTPSKSNTAFWEGSIPWLTPKDMASFDGTTQDRVSAMAIGKGTKLAPANAIFIAVRGMSLHNEIRIVRPNKEMAFNQDIKSIVPTDAIDGTFLFYALKDRVPNLLSQVHAAGHGTGVLATELINSTPIPVFSMPEQLAIGAALSELDDKIELNWRMNETLEEMARALFRDWFVDFGPTRRQMEGASDPTAIMGHAFPPEKAATLAPLFPAKLGNDGLPEGWEKRVLHDLTEWVNGAAYKNMHFSKEPDALPVIKIAELKAGVTKTTKHTNTALGDKYRIKNGEVLFSWSGNPDTSIETFIWSGGDAWLNQHIFAVRPNGEVDQSVLYFLLKHLRPQFAEIARDKQTTGLGHVTKQDLKGMRVCLGSDEVESAATEVFKPMFAKLYANQQENQTLAALRDLLLPKLMSGEIRLKDAENAS